MAADDTIPLHPADARRTAALASVVRMPSKGGMGVVAARDLGARVLVGPYPGRRLTLAAHSTRMRSGVTDGKYAVAFFKFDRGGTPRTNYVVDPGDARGGLLPEFGRAVTPLVNEPGDPGTPNLLWAWNLPKGRMEMWTARPVRKGEELTACYGTGGGYERAYRTACTAAAGDVEPELHVVTRARAKPVPYSSLGLAGIRAAAGSGTTGRRGQRGSPT